MPKKPKNSSLPEGYEVIAIKDTDNIPTIKVPEKPKLVPEKPRETFALGDMCEVQLPLNLFKKISDGSADVLAASEQAIQATLI